MDFESVASIIVGTIASIQLIGTFCGVIKPTQKDIYIQCCIILIWILVAI